MFHLVSWSSKRQPMVLVVQAPADGLPLQCRGEVPRYRKGMAEASWLRQLLAELHSPLLKHTGLLRQRQCGVSLHQPYAAPADQTSGDQSALGPRSSRYRRCSGPPRSDHLLVCRHLHQGPPVLDLQRVSLQPQHHRWLVASVGGSCVCFFSCPVCNSAALVVQTAGGVGVCVN